MESSITAQTLNMVVKQALYFIALFVTLTSFFLSAQCGCDPLPPPGLDETILYVNSTSELFKPGRTSHPGMAWILENYRRARPDYRLRFWHIVWQYRPNWCEPYGRSSPEQRCEYGLFAPGNMPCEEHALHFNGRNDRWTYIVPRRYHAGIRCHRSVAGMQGSGSGTRFILYQQCVEWCIPGMLVVEIACP